MFGNIVGPILVILLIKQLYGAKFEMKSVRCEAIDPDFARFDLCDLVTDNSKIPKVSVILRLLKVPITNCRVGTSVGFASATSMPLVKNSWDLCSVMKSIKRNRSFARLYDYIAPFTNFNHTCPYNHDLYLTNFYLSEMKPLFPVPNGIYVVKTDFTINGKKQYSIEISMDIKN